MPQTFVGFSTTDLMSAISLIIALSAFLIVFVRNADGSKVRMRIKAIEARRAELKAELLETPTKARKRIAQRSPLAERAFQKMRQFKLIDDDQLKATELLLWQAGLRSNDLAIAVILSRAVLPILFGGAALVAIFGLKLWPDMSAIKRALIVGGAIVAGYKGASIYLNNRVTKRIEAIRLGIPDALDLLVICAESGVSVDAALVQVGQSLENSYPELADEISLTAVELGFLTERRQAYENLSKRVPLDALQGVCTTLIQTEKYGTPLSSALRVLTAEFRNDRMMRAEEKAARLPVLMTIPLVTFIMPSLFIVILGPATCSIMDTLSKI
jgi:tight adherence protein C